ncbi:MAG: glycosyltransferase [Phycisphaerae bacterium]|nr:glycosyltransferase [Phycisphaerae bacterium]
MHVLLVTLGTAGDVHPYLGLGRRLRARGHRVTTITSGYFERQVRQAGLDFAPLGTAEEYRSIIRDGELWHHRQAFRAFAERVVPLTLEPIYERVAEHYVPGETVAAASWNAFGARIAQERLGLPLVTIHTVPSGLRSVYRTPVLSEFPVMQWIPWRWRKVAYTLIDLTVFDRMLRPAINRFRARLNLPSIRRFVSHWWDSPDRIIGLFPEWFSPPQRDWPRQVRLTGFPRYDGGEIEPLPSEVREFLDAGDPPIVFTPGSPIQEVRWFFQASIEACRLLGRRGLLLTRFPEQVPKSLPPEVRHFDYLPFSRLLPQAAALVHHGGIGSAAQAMAAGIPQLVMPICNDQPDTAARLIRLGVGDALHPGRYRGAEVADRLRRLLGSKETAANCRMLAHRIKMSDPLDEACLLTEQLGGGAARVTTGCSPSAFVA